MKSFSLQTAGRRILICLVLLLIILLPILWLRHDHRPVLVCLGDSLTSCGGPGGHYSDWLAKLLPNVRIIDAGIGGDTLEGGRARFEKDVMQHHPNVLLIALGANDFWRNARPVSAMRKDLEEMVQMAQSNQCQVVIAGCFGDRSFWDELCTEFDPRRFSLAKEIAAFEKEICARYQCRYIPNLQVDVKPNRLPPYWDETDHPNKKGNEQVALRLLPDLRAAIAKCSHTQK